MLALLPGYGLPLLPRHHLLKLLPQQPTSSLYQASHDATSLERKALERFRARRPLLVHNA